MSIRASSPIPARRSINGITLYMKQHGPTVAGKKIEVIRKDTGGIAPDLAKRLAQEAVVRDQAESSPASRSRRMRWRLRISPRKRRSSWWS